MLFKSCVFLASGSLIKFLSRPLSLSLFTYKSTYKQDVNMYSFLKRRYLNIYIYIYIYMMHTPFLLPLASDRINLRESSSKGKYNSWRQNSKKVLFLWCEICVHRATLFLMQKGQISIHDAYFQFETFLKMGVYKQINI